MSDVTAFMVELSGIVEECNANISGLFKLSADLRESTTKFSIDAML